MLIGLIISKLTGVIVDGYLGIAVAIFILYTGINTIRDSISPLLGNAPNPEFVKEITDTVMQNDMIVGLHDLIVHDYGPGRCIISLHAEIPYDEDILKAHDSIDLIEKALERKFNCLATIHMDPIATNDEYTLSLKDKVCHIVNELNESYSIHDFRVVHGDTHTNIIFDMVVPFGCKQSDDEIHRLFKQRIQKLDPKLIPVMHIEQSYSN